LMIAHSRFTPRLKRIHGELHAAAMCPVGLPAPVVVAQAFKPEVS
jgi:hypothetical protein